MIVDTRRTPSIAAQLCPTLLSRWPAIPRGSSACRPALAGAGGFGVARRTEEQVKHRKVAAKARPDGVGRRR